MDNVRIVLAVLFLIVAYKVVINHIRVMRLQALLKMFKRNDGTIKTQQKIMENSDAILSLFRRAKLEEPTIPYAQNMGLGLVNPTQIPVWHNLHLYADEVIQAGVLCFYTAIGYYKQRRNEALFPSYWIEFVLFAPRNLLSYIGFDANSALVKGLNVLLGLLLWLVGLSLSFRR